MKAVFGKDNDAIDASTAAALLAATYSGGDEKVCVRDYGRAQTRVRGGILLGGKNRFMWRWRGKAFSNPAGMGHRPVRVHV